MRLFVDLDETLVRALKGYEGDLPERYPEDHEPDLVLTFDDISLFTFLRPDLHLLRDIPFSVFSLGTEGYVKAIATYLISVERLCIQNIFSREDAWREGDTRPPIDSEPCILIDESDFVDRKLFRLPRCHFIKVHAWDSVLFPPVPPSFSPKEKLRWVKKNMDRRHWTLQYKESPESVSLPEAIQQYLELI